MTIDHQSIADVELVVEKLNALLARMRAGRNDDWQALTAFEALSYFPYGTLCDAAAQDADDLRAELGVDEEGNPLDDGGEAIYDDGYNGGTIDRGYTPLRRAAVDPVAQIMHELATARPECRA